jgi:hypothetical protein
MRSSLSAFFLSLALSTSAVAQELSLGTPVSDQSLQTETVVPNKDKLNVGTPVNRKTKVIANVCATTPSNDCKIQSLITSSHELVFFADSFTGAHLGAATYFERARINNQEENYLIGVPVDNFPALVFAYRG